MSMKVVVTGGRGFIGSNLVDTLVERGFDVHSVDVAEATRTPNSLATYHAVDIRNEIALAPILAGSHCVLHLAALPRVQYSIENPIETCDVNVRGTMVVLKVAADVGVRRMVFSSSAAVYGDQAVQPLEEEMQLSPKSPYALHKEIGERACKLWSDLYGLQTVSLRYFNVYGPGLDPNGAYALALGKFLRIRKEGGIIEIWGDGKNTRDYVHVTDVAHANLLAMDSTRVGAGECINIGTGKETDVNTLAGLIGGQTRHVSQRTEPGRSCASVQRAKSLLGWEPSMSLEAGIVELRRTFQTA